MICAVFFTEFNLRKLNNSFSNKFPLMKINVNFTLLEYDITLPFLRAIIKFYEYLFFFVFLCT